MSRKSLFKTIRIVTTAALLVYVFHKAGLFTSQGWQELWAVLRQANPWLVVLSFCITVALNFCSSVKWWMLARSRGLEVGLRRLWAFYMVGLFFNLVLPSSVGGDVIRAHEMGRYTGRYADSTATVFVERFSGLVVLVGLALIAVTVNTQRFNMPWLTISLGIGAIGVGIICWLIVDARPFRWTQQLIAPRVPLVGKLLVKIGKFRDAVNIYRSIPGALPWAFINSLIFYTLAILNVWVTLLAFRADVNLFSMMVAVPVIMFIMNIPFSVGGIGLLEFGFEFVLGLFGVAPAIAVSTALLMRIKSLIDAGIGSALYPLVSGGQDIAELQESVQAQPSEPLS